MGSLYGSIITPSNQTCASAVCPLHGVRLLTKWNRALPVAPACPPVPPATRALTACEFVAVQFAGSITCTNESASMNTLSPLCTYSSVALRSKIRLVVVLVQAEAVTLKSPPSVSIPEPENVSSMFSGKAPQRATFGPAFVSPKLSVPLHCALTGRPVWRPSKFRCSNSSPMRLVLRLLTA